MRNSPVTRDELDVLQRTIEDLRRDVLLLKNQHSPTVPVYLPDVPDDQIDGQVALVPVAETLDVTDATVKPAWSFGGLWRSLVGIVFDKAPQDGTFLTVWASGDPGVSPFVGGVNLFAYWAVQLLGGSNDDGSSWSTEVVAGPTDASITSLTGSAYMNAGTSPEAKVETDSTGKITLSTGGVSFVEVRPDGTLHIKTGATWVADL